MDQTITKKVKLHYYIYGEPFRVLKEKEIKQFGEYRTRRLVLEAWDKLVG